MINKILDEPYWDEFPTHFKDFFNHIKVNKVGIRSNVEVGNFSRADAIQSYISFLRYHSYKNNTHVQEGIVQDLSRGRTEFNSSIIEFGFSVEELLEELQDYNTLKQFLIAYLPSSLKEKLVKVNNLEEIWKLYPKCY